MSRLAPKVSSARLVVHALRIKEVPNFCEAAGTSPERGTPNGPFGGVECQRELPTIELGCTLQRLFSTFPNSWPGVGLLLLRACLGIALLYFAVAGLSENPSEPITIAQNLIAFAGGILLLAGLWNPGCPRRGVDRVI